VTSREDRVAMQNLQELLAADLAAADLDAILGGIRDAEHTFDRAQEWSGRLIAELRRRDLSWSRLVTLTGLPQTTLWRRAQPYLGDTDRQE
jgi:hypothetical protein